ncbi:hypothetical protein DPMN_031410 [Dreissena polymorpha]|uniref:Uncharacterized protein n=1 Tax=Dreissena polymorpha TaxID=45954 RepID=A0A9D4M0Z9_DREPO|nr:hypothetical protein DPMN_031410 [Dreissena polymorpha]
MRTSVTSKSQACQLQEQGQDEENPCSPFWIRRFRRHRFRMNHPTVYHVVEDRNQEDPTQK